MPNPPRARRTPLLAGLLIQALIWVVLTVAFAALLRLGGSPVWFNNFRFAALAWLPWMVLAPIVFGFSRRFPLRRGQLWLTVPAHVVACIVCVAITSWASTYLAGLTRPEPPHPEMHVEEGERSWTPHVPSDPAAAEPATPAPETAPRPEPPEARWRAERFERRPFNRRGHPRPLWASMLIRANFDGAVFLIVVIAAHAFGFYRQAQERDRHATELAAGLNRAKLDALRLQLQPHFLFNTLNAISTLVHRDANAADELIGDLSELLRLSLQTTDHQVPLQRELELLDCYVAIEQTRLGDRLRVIRDIQPDTNAALVPTFVLQPLVENAIRHGIEPRVAPGTVKIQARREHDRLVLIVADDGVGLTNSVSGLNRRGIGITNTEERLRALHGQAASLALGAPRGGGVEVRIELPFVTTPAAPAPRTT